MAHVPPSAEELKERYPAFASVTEDIIEHWLADAQSTVTTGWIEADYAPAIMALAAHRMARNGTGPADACAAGGMAGVTSFRSGAFSASFAEAAVSAAVKGGYASTPYGQDFAVYLRRNRAGPRVATGGRLGCAFR
ncbi:MAG: DUF4054 domain-containing protein [Sphingobium sp.]